MESEGKNLKELLKGNNTFIALASQRIEGERDGLEGYVFFINANGWQKRRIHMPKWMSYIRKEDLVDHPPEKITLREAVEAAIIYREMSPNEVVNYVRRRMQKIPPSDSSLPMNEVYEHG